MASNDLVDILIEILSEAYTPGKQIWIRPRVKAQPEKPIQQGAIKDFVKKAINNSIDHRWLLNINYEGDAENVPGRRWVEPYVWGNHVRTQNDVLRAWQYQGTSAKTKGIDKGWKMFRLDRITNTAPLTTKTFDRARPGYNPDDKHMSGIKNKVEFPGGDSGANDQAPPAPEPNNPAPAGTAPTKPEPPAAPGVQPKKVKPVAPTNQPSAPVPKSGLGKEPKPNPGQKIRTPLTPGEPKAKPNLKAAPNKKAPVKKVINKPVNKKVVKKQKRLREDQHLESILFNLLNELRDGQN